MEIAPAVKKIMRRTLTDLETQKYSPEIHRCLEGVGWSNVGDLIVSARALKDTACAGRIPTPETFSQATRNLMHLDSLSLSTRFSLKCLSGVQRLFRYPDCDLAPEKIPAYRQLILNKIGDAADRMLGIAQSFNPDDLLDEECQRAHVQLASAIARLGLSHLRNAAVPPQEDLPLMEKIFEEQPQFFLRFRSILAKRKQLVLIALEGKRCRLEDVAESFRDDQEILLRALRVDRSALRLASPRLRCDETFMLSALWELDAAVLAFANRSLTLSSAFMLRAIALDPNAVNFAARELLKDAAFGLNAVTLHAQTGLALDSVLWRDAIFFRSALQANPELIRYLVNYITPKEHRRFSMLLAIHCNCNAFRLLPQEERVDTEFIEAAAGENCAILRDLDAELKCDRALFLNLVMRNGLTLEFADEVVRGEWEVAMCAVVQNAAAMRFVADSLKRNRNFVLAVLNLIEPLETRRHIWPFLSPSLTCDEVMNALIWGQ